jgi:uncharacterized membrane protein
MSAVEDTIPGVPSTSSPARQAVGAKALARVRSATALDAGGDLLRSVADRLRLPAMSARGEDLLGHPVHPALTDLPIGFWTSSCFLDVVGGRHHVKASRRLVGAGILTALPAVAFGLGDLPKLDPQARRVATVHAASNLLAIVVYTASWRRRRRGHAFSGVVLGFGAGAIASLGGYLGGALAFSSFPEDESADQPTVA